MKGVQNDTQVQKRQTVEGVKNAEKGVGADTKGGEKILKRGYNLKNGIPGITRNGVKGRKRKGGTSAQSCISAESTTKRRRGGGKRERGAYSH